ncbi:sugar ABC transporter permease [Bacillus paralicheniformis]|jgi:multiple sugar transport system permease protein|uniref:carbohydrate ABC transporter permease n=1 Tax=Bacillus paralicheniformis TaxID=1648923 RepID=UPI0003424950|nr:sugar ABC transporter permease [Bacillus paralicheniformis]KJD55082.1 ABC transporter permease [Bacillus amyloliquefaciens]KUL13712.1 ABC transporter permease [Bacillus licheniformis LMG 7559]AGN37919.1 carbohydrate ABC transporter permease FrlN [Bacillus paralicheniformis ATCC 9945a]ARA87213.1 ABC transporter permease [Bacillus paralicheniformis]AYQ17986.1 sugar ABC transporter permease [Bacillus paralicheniformis]
MIKAIIRKWEGCFYLFPAVLFMLTLIGYPLIYNIILSFQNVSLANIASKDISFIGIDNYQRLAQDKVFWASLKNTLLYTAGSVVFQFAIGFLLALFFSMKFRLAPFLRGLMMVSWLIPLTVTALLFKFMMASNEGVFNQLLLSWGMIDNPIPWLSDPKIAIWSVIIANIWVGIPFNMLLISAGLSSLPEDVYESASLDGANAFQKFIHLTLPLLRPVITVVMMLGFIYTFKVFDLVFVMTGGGPVHATEVLSTVSYRYSFDEFQFSMGAASANVLFFILLLVSLVYLRLIKKDEVMS